MKQFLKLFRDLHFVDMQQKICSDIYREALVKNKVLTVIPSEVSNEGDKIK